MDFEYTVNGVISIPEKALNKMAKQVKKGKPIEYVVEQYIVGLEDCDYYNASAFDYKIINEVRKRVRVLKN